MPPLLLRWRVGLLAAVLEIASLAGCGDGRPPRVPVCGRVLIDGEPLRHGYVRLVPDDARAAGGAVDEQGRFTLSCYAENDGVVPGRHRVEILGCEYLGEDGVRWHAPKRYADVATSNLEVVVDGPTDDLHLELSWEGGRPFVETFRR